MEEAWSMKSTDPSLVLIGKRIYQRRKNLGLTQEQLAEAADLTPQFISFAESGKRAMRIDNIVKLAKALQVSTDFLLTGERIDRDKLYFSEKLQELNDEQLAHVERIVDECVAMLK